MMLSLTALFLRATRDQFPCLLMFDDVARLMWIRSWLIAVKRTSCYGTDSERPRRLVEYIDLGIVWPGCVMVGATDSKGRGFDSRSFHLQVHDLGQVVHTHCASVTKQYNLVPVEGGNAVRLGR